MTDQKCQYCGLIHGAKCPSVKAIEYNPDGSVKRVEFFAPNDYLPKLGAPFPLPPYDVTCGHVPSSDVPMRWSDAHGWQRVDGGSYQPGL
jgi:hypothetical protein